LLDEKKDGVDEEMKSQIDSSSDYKDTTMSLSKEIEQYIENNSHIIDGIALSNL